MASDAHLVQILLPLVDGDGAPIDPLEFEALSERLTAEYGGITAYTRSPAEGRWRNDDLVQRDEIVVFEVLVRRLDVSWWKAFRVGLEGRFKQNSVLILAHPVDVL